MADAEERFDVIVAGGGNVGLTTACALADGGLTVAVVEPRRFPDTSDAGEHNPRVFAVTRASERIFTALDVWDRLPAGAAYPFREMHVWDAGGDGSVHFDSAELGEPYLGHMIEPQLIQAALLDRVRTLPSITLLCPAHVAGVELSPAAARVTLEGGRTLCAELVVGADGANSPVREQLGIPVRRHDYRQGGLVARVRTEHDHRDTAWQRFLPGGPLAFLPTADGWSSIVWTLPAETAATLREADTTTFHAALGEAFEYRLGRIVESGPREVFPLQRLHADHYVGERVALAGDAAHAIHPLAGQGINLGLLDAATLAEVVLSARDQHSPFGSRYVLRRYERRRRGDNQLMMSAMDGFNRLFGNEWPVLRRIRNLGLSLAERSLPVKTLLARHAMGLAGELPALARQPAPSP